MAPNGSVKFVAILARRPDLTMDEFKEHYESTHARLIETIVGPWLVDYRRSYVDASTIAGTEEALGFDVITEMWWRSRADYAAARNALREPENLSRILADEANFLDRSRKRTFVVEEHTTG